MAVGERRLSRLRRRALGAVPPRDRHAWSQSCPGIAEACLMLACSTISLSITIPLAPVDLTHRTASCRCLRRLTRMLGSHSPISVASIQVVRSRSLPNTSIGHEHSLRV
jgi:hypothetical protein